MCTLSSMGFRFSVYETHPQWFEGLCVRQELEKRGGGEQQEGSVDGLSSLQTRERELVEAVTCLVPHSRLKTTTTTTTTCQTTN